MIANKRKAGRKRRSKLVKCEYCSTPGSYGAFATDVWHSHPENCPYYKPEKFMFDGLVVQKIKCPKCKKMTFVSKGVILLHDKGNYDNCPASFRKYENGKLGPKEL